MFTVITLFQETVVVDVCWKDFFGCRDFAIPLCLVTIHSSLSPPLPLRSVKRDFAFQSLHLKTCSGALSQLSNASSQIHVNFHLHPLRLCHHHITEKRKKIKRSGAGLKLKGLSYILLQWESVPPTGKRADMRVREGGCWGSTCCRCPTVLTARIREGEKYLLETHRALDIFYACRIVPCKAL